MDIDEICAKLASRLRCVRTTPFGFPALPLVKRSAASCRSPVRGRPMRPATHWFGRSHAAASHGSIARLPPGRLDLGAQVERPLGPREVREARRIASADRTVRTPETRDARLGGGRCPTVKLKFTGTLPAHTTARFAIAAPAPGGRTMPTRLSGTVARSRRASTAAAAISWAAVSTRRSAVRSTSATEPGPARERAHHLAAHVPSQQRPLGERDRPELHERPPRRRRVRPSRGGMRLAEHDADGSRQQARGLPEVLVPRKGEHGSPEPVDRRGNDRDAGRSRHELKALAHRHQLARARDAALREHADELALVEGPDRAPAATAADGSG